MNRYRTTALILAAGLATPVLAIDKSWNSNSGNWSEAASWWPVGVPIQNDGVFIGNIASVENDTVTLDQSPTVAALTISDGMTLRTDNRSLRVDGNTLITGSNTVVGQGGIILSFPSRLLLEPVDGLTFRTESMSVVSGARLVLDPAIALIEDTLTIGASSRIEGRGSIDIDGTGTSLNNNGLINAGPNEGLRFRQFFGGLYNLDGTTENGVLALTNMSGASLAFQGTGLTDPFDSSISMSMNSELDMDLSNGWIASQNAVITVTNAGDVVAPSRIVGGPFTFAGELNVSGAQAGVELTPTELVLQPSARINLGADTSAEIGAPAGTHTTVNGGEYTLGQSGFLVFYGPTTVAGGSFTTPSTNPVDGTLVFIGPTEWDGNVTFNGYARQSADAAVTGPTIITADVFDMDGVVVSSSWLIQSSLTLNAGAIESGGVDSVGSSITINGGPSSRLTVNLDDPSGYWIAAGELNLGGLAGGMHLPVTRIAGSPVWVTGDLNVATGRVDISAPVRIMGDAVVSIDAASAELRLRAESVIFPGAFEGDGKLTSGPGGDVTLETGVSTGTVGLLNQGILRIGEMSGIASVDRFENTGAWHVQIGGYSAGTEYDQLIVSGGAATIAGTLAIELIDEHGVGSAFQPVVGDSFTILTAVGGVDGAFPAEVVTVSDGSTYEWSVASNPNDVTITLEHVTPSDCGADFNHDGVVNSQDFFDFLSEFFVQGARADVNGDGVVNSQDFFDFLVMFFNGCG